MDIHQVIIRPVVSEKSVSLQGVSKYAFLVRTGANKIDIRKAVEQMYAVKVQSVNVLMHQGKSRNKGRSMTVRRRERRKAIVTLKQGQVLDPGKIYAEHKTKDTNKS